MNQHAFSWNLFARAPIVGIVRNLSVADVRQILPVYRDAGLTTIEITMNTPGAEDLIRYARMHVADGMNIGAGTVCTPDDLERALAAGAQFIVTPIIDEKVIHTCLQRNVPIFPGAFTPSEVFKVWSLGAPMVKVFPTTTLGPDYIRDLKGPLNQIRLLPTGGVSLDTMAHFFKAGADGVGVGSHLFDRNLIRAKDWTGLYAHFRDFLSRLPNLNP
ncbi:bifunctional 4-hydroxy-2-oxoglutarate aldolase/2-dehydro-3-deoxy-phosphogluconate aldolase [Spirosoma taeanense]|uniref:Bifunctional 4-hydroxy-2-oxoglutarate aldolase/2-dehydro-3-deoxy-phosphogluconate aldolase n=1 Tax=Spirosoma taeanense TaxID=2735870 RepID=A0A6M5YD44_9BACT|nr:bifunctional 4-hydroxy-2-oxoglutarate aldolase/2-dehydro-3-deoxy-phosphogluconate aldolase [Spirosoma taeanense]QJW90882.1 bifunctional 4-hydroxy-2-oxoglutarate aldolase/2-dehydro-3-deoxy-phosphogluconate aldolase [Spirosoma taeanense]